MLCSSCRIPFTDEQESRCYLCNRLTSQNKVCSSCRSRSSLRRVWWLGNYNDILKTLIHDMKFQRKRAYAREFGTILAQALPYLHESTVVVSVPTASTRIRRRGYDQAALIAQSFARTRNLRYQNALVRTSQVDLIGKDRSSRLKQMASATELRIQASFKGQSILLIDDVLTTGASIEAAARLLRKNGAQHVDAAVVARHMLG